MGDRAGGRVGIGALTGAAAESRVPARRDAAGTKRPTARLPGRQKSPPATAFPKSRSSKRGAGSATAPLPRQPTSLLKLVGQHSSCSAPPSLRNRVVPRARWPWHSWPLRSTRTTEQRRRPAQDMCGRASKILRWNGRPSGSPGLARETVESSRETEHPRLAGRTHSSSTPPVSAGGGTRTHTPCYGYWILNPARLPIPPLRLLKG